MTSQLTTLNERDKPKSNYQLNMEILTSLKSLPGKVINLQNEKFHFPNEGKDKGKPNLAEEKKTTSSSIPNELFYDPFNDMEKSNKCFNTTNSIFKPMTCFQNKSPTMNSFELNSRMSYPYYFPYNQNITNLSNPAKFSNLSFSQNSFYPFANQDMKMMNYSTYNRINQINSFPSIFPTFTQYPIFNNTNNINIFNITPINNNNSNFLTKKRTNITDNVKIIQKEESITESTNNIKILPKSESTEKNKEVKKLFTVIPKSSYNYKIRKQRIKNSSNENSKDLICGHEGCDAIFKTRKQILFHHYKMNHECHSDTLALLKMLNATKAILLRRDDKKILEKYSKLYKESMEKISLNEYIETMVGFNLEDNINNE